MRALHYSIIVISLIGISFFVSEDAYGCLGNCPPIIPPPHYASPPITVHTNLENYSTGDDIIITGHVFNQTKDTPLIIKIYDPIRQFRFDKNVSVSSDGSYTWTLSTVNFWSFNASGNYTVLAQYGQVYATTNFNLNSTLTQYLYAQSPLWQFKNGMSAQDVHCHAGFSLIIRKENFAPACTYPITATKLILSGWALGTPPIQRFISDIDISELQKNYTVGQPIDATVNYAGYWSVSWAPDVKIFDANYTQIWFNCPNCVTNDTILGGGPHFPSYGNFTYHVRDHNEHLPIINETGTYTMVVSLANKTAIAEFTVVKPTLPKGISSLENDVGTVTFGNRVYYFETPNYTHEAYFNPVQISFHDVIYTLFPSGFRGGLPVNGCGGQYYWTDAKFSDGTSELLHIFVGFPKCAAPQPPTYFSTHTNPQAGLTFYDGKMKLLVSTSTINSSGN